MGREGNKVKYGVLVSDPQAGSAVIDAGDDLKGAEEFRDSLAASGFEILGIAPIRAKDDPKGDKWGEPAEKMYTRDQVSEAVNDGINMVDSAMGDVYNLMVNTIMTVLDDPEADLRAVVEKNY
jgi:hypothetical protein